MKTLVEILTKFDFVSVFNIDLISCRQTEKLRDWQTLITSSDRCSNPGFRDKNNQNLKVFERLTLKSKLDFKNIFSSDCVPTDGEIERCL